MHGLSDLLTGNSVTVARWTRYGKDRLYVTALDGQRVGWHDLLTGQDTIERTEVTDAFSEAVSAFQRASGLPAASTRRRRPGRRRAADGCPGGGRARRPHRSTGTFPGAGLDGPGAQQPGQGARAEAESLLADDDDAGRLPGHRTQPSRVSSLLTTASGVWVPAAG